VSRSRILSGGRSIVRVAARPSRAMRIGFMVEEARLAGVGEGWVV
jgi:hypothetical protein